MVDDRPLSLYVLVVLAAEKFVQHMFVTWAFLVDYGGIRSSVVVDHRLLVVSGFVVGLLFAVTVPFLLRRREWSFRLLFGLALFDVVGEFVAQGTLAITIVVSFIVACTILGILVLRWDRLVHPGRLDA